MITKIVFSMEKTREPYQPADFYPQEFAEKLVSYLDPKTKGDLFTCDKHPTNIDTRPFSGFLVDRSDILRKKERIVMIEGIEDLMESKLMLRGGYDLGIITFEDRYLSLREIMESINTREKINRYEEGGEFSPFAGVFDTVAELRDSGILDGIPEYP